MPITTYKGTDKDMKCHGGFEYELGKEYTDDGAIKCDDKGFHSCQVPMDVWSYFQPTEERRFFQCEAGGTIDQSDTDSKIASSELEIKTEIGILGIIKAQIEYVKRFANGNIAQGLRGRAAAQGDLGHSVAQGDQGRAVAQGNNGHAVAQGNLGHSAAQGDWGHSAAQGHRGHSAAQGDLGHSVAQGDWAHSAAQGDLGHSAAQGDWGHAAAQGDGGRAEVHGEHSIAAAFGINGRVLGGRIGDLLTLYQWGKIEGNWAPISGVTVTVDGEKIKTDTWYKLVDGEFVEDDEK